MEGDRRFGMVQSCCQSETGIYAIGTECEIVECEPLADGRYFLEVIGRRRFEIAELKEQDGYRIARGRYFQDHPVPKGSPDMHIMQEHLKTLQVLQQSFKDRGIYRRRTLMIRDLVEEGNNVDLETMSFIACAMIVNPDGSPTRRKFLEIRNTLQRTEWILQCLNHV